MTENLDNRSIASHVIPMKIGIQIRVLAGMTCVSAAAAMTVA
jgi:hypothetical protein